MRTRITIDDKLLSDLREGLGIQDINVLVRQALIEVRQRIAIERLIALGGSDPDAWAPDENKEASG